jgi:hypothetical protein
VLSSERLSLASLSRVNGHTSSKVCAVLRIYSSDCLERLNEKWFSDGSSLL